MTTFTVAEAIKHFEVEIDPHLEREVDIPVNGGIQRQGDVLVRPAKAPKNFKGQGVPLAGIAVVRGENGGNTHLLLAQGESVRYMAVDNSGDLAEAVNLRIGVLDVPEGATAYFAHPEHGYLGIAPGTYEIRRQREFADTIRQIAD